MKTLTTLLIVLFVSNFGYSQYSGYLGKKNYVSTNFRFYNPYFYNRKLTYQKVQDIDKDVFAPIKFKDRINTAFSFTIGHAFSNRFAMSLEVGIQQGKVGMKESRSLSYQTYDSSYMDYVNHSGQIYSTPFRVNTLQIMPTFEFSGDGGLAPVGLVNKIGFGICRTKIIADDDYKIFIEKQNPNTFATEYHLHATGRDAVSTDAVFKSAVLFYELGLRLPITKRLAYYFGVRYQLGYSTGVTLNSGSSGEYTNKSFAEDMGAYSFNNFVQANFGLNLNF